MKKSKDYKPGRNVYEREDLEKVESGPTRKPGAFAPEPGMTYKKPKGGEEHD